MNNRSDTEKEIDDEQDPRINPDKTDKLSDMTKTETARKHAPSGAYYYVYADEEELSRTSFIRTLLTVIAAMLQLVALVLPQYEYVTLHYPSFAFTYSVFILIVYLPVTLYTLIINCTRYKLKKRIPAERAPKRGFSKRTFISSEIFTVVNALSFIAEIAFVCLRYNGFALLGMFVCLLATAAAVAARMFGWYALKDAEYIAPPDETKRDERDEDRLDTTNATTD